uniref:Uncharacterized protein n=1 Tax=Caenorhabditis japonica TaxID=281687 RepID=A0A8R1IB32_CAEJA
MYTFLLRPQRLANPIIQFERVWRPPEEQNLAILSILDKLPAELLIVNVWHKRTELLGRGGEEGLVGEGEPSAFLCRAEGTGRCSPSLSFPVLAHQSRHASIPTPTYNHLFIRRSE